MHILLLSPFSVSSRNSIYCVHSSAFYPPSLPLRFQSKNAYNEKDTPECLQFGDRRSEIGDRKSEVGDGNAGFLAGNSVSGINGEVLEGKGRAR